MFLLCYTKIQHLEYYQNIFQKCLYQQIQCTTAELPYFTDYKSHFFLNLAGPATYSQVRLICQKIYADARDMICRRCGILSVTFSAAFVLKTSDV